MIPKQNLILFTRDELKPADRYRNLRRAVEEENLFDKWIPVEYLHDILSRYPTHVPMVNCWTAVEGKYQGCVYSIIGSKFPDICREFNLPMRGHALLYVVRGDVKKGETERQGRFVLDLQMSMGTCGMEVLMYPVEDHPKYIIVKVNDAKTARGYINAYIRQADYRIQILMYDNIPNPKYPILTRKDMFPKLSTGKFPETWIERALPKPSKPKVRTSSEKHPSAQ